MANKKNKVKFNLKNAHYAMLSVSEAGEISYGKPVPMPGSVSISLDANGEPENFYADGVAYYVINNNMGYDGDLELAMIPESFRTDALGEKLDDKGVLIENAEVSFPPLRCCLSLTATSGISGMCCITARLPGRALRGRPMRRAGRCRRRRLR